MNNILTYSNNNILHISELPPSGEIQLQNDMKILLSISSPNDMDALEFIREKFDPRDYHNIFKHCRSNNPLIDKYEDWLSNWREDCIQSQPKWRENTDLYSFIKKNNGIQRYIKKTQNIKFLTYDPEKYTPEEALKIEKQRLISQDASTYINSIGRPDLVTTVDENGLVILKKIIF